MANAPAPAVLTALPPYKSFPISDESGNITERWDRWKKGFVNLMMALGIQNQQQKKAILIYYGGEEFEKTLSNLPNVGDTCDTAIAAFDAHVAPQKNIEFEVYKFRKAQQDSRESIDKFHLRLRELSSNCGFADDDKEIKSQVIQGCYSSRLRRKILQDSEKPLNDILKMARAMELSEQQAGEMEGSSSTAARAPDPVNRVKPAKNHPPQKKPYKPHSQKSSSRSYQPKQVRQSSAKKCWFCGGEYPHTGICPAKGQTCTFCKKPDHLASVCHSKQREERPFHRGGKSSTRVRALEEGTIETDYVFAVQQNVADDEGTVSVSMCGSRFCMLVDTGTPRRNIIDVTTYRSLRYQPKLSPANIRLIPYGCIRPLPTLGKFSAVLYAGDQSVDTEMFVVNKHRAGNLMSRRTAVALGIIPSLVATIHDSEGVEDILEAYSDRFQGLGKLKDYQVHLHIDPQAKPVAQSHRRVPFSLRDKVAQKIKELEDLDVIEEIEGPTPWVSPIVCTPKPKSGEIRMCVDMRVVNQHIARERHLTPTLNELMAEVSGATFFSKLDLNSGYHQLELDEESRNLTVFSSHVGLRRYKRLNFGVNSASEIFQNAINQVISGIQGAINISDDILLFSRGDVHNHRELLKSVLERLRDKNITLNRDKCQFLKKRLEFAGHIWSTEGVQPDPKKVQAIVEAPAPTNVSEVRSFLGMVNYVSRFIPNMATVSEPLRVLTKKDQEWKWGDEQEAAFQSLKGSISSPKVMAFFDTNKDVTLLVDASPIGLGAVLSQDGRVVAYASRSLSDVEQRYSQTEREALAIKWACGHFRLYIYGKPVQIITDHKPLEALFSNPHSKPPPRIERWMVSLQDYDLKVKYQPGKDNPADFMSRHPIKTESPDGTFTEEYVNFVLESARPRALSLDDIKCHTGKDTQLQTVIDVVQTGQFYKLLKCPDPEMRSFYNVRDELCVSEDNILLRGRRIVIPSKLRLQVVKLAHIGHQGINKTKALLRTKVWFPGMDTLAEAEVKNCLPCQASTKSPAREPLKMTPCPDAPWEQVSTDFMGPLSSGEYLLVVIDDLSRYPEVEITHSTSARATIPALDKIFAAHGIPTKLKSDNGPPFNSSDFTKFAETMGFKHQKVTPEWPEANGEAERFMRTLKKALHVAVAQGKPWRQELWSFLRQYRASPHASTQIPPATVLYGREIRTEIPSLSSPEIKTSAELKVSDGIAKSVMKEYADEKRHVRKSDICEGDSVLLKNPSPRKLDPPYYPDIEQVVSRKGDMVTSTNGQRNITRNISKFKKVNAQYMPMSAPDQDDIDLSESFVPNTVPNPVLDNPPAISQENVQMPSPAKVSVPTPRPARVRQPPKYLQDYVTK